MNVTYMPFTYLSQSTARVLKSLFGPVTVIQPLKSAVPEELASLSDQGLIEIKLPVEEDDERLRAALLEFTEWARMNPGATLAGSEFIGTRQGEVPFFGETSINRIRSEIKHHGSRNEESEKSDLIFCARLFLAIAQENDRSTDNLNQDLEDFEAMEKNFLASMVDADDARFNRQPPGSELWQEDKGAKMTRQRIRSWATLAVAGEIPDVFVTTSSAAIDYLQENHLEKGKVEKLAAFTIKRPSTDDAGVLKPMVEDLLRQTDLSMFDPTSLNFPGSGSSTKDELHISMFAVYEMSSDAFLRILSLEGLMDERNEDRAPCSHTLIFSVESK